VRDVITLLPACNASFAISCSRSRTTCTWRICQEGYNSGASSQLTRFWYRFILSRCSFRLGPDIVVSTHPWTYEASQDAHSNTARSCEVILGPG